MTRPVHVSNQPRLFSRSTTERGESSSTISMHAVDHLETDAPPPRAVVAMGSMQQPLPQSAQNPAIRSGDQQPLTDFVHSLRQEAAFDKKYDDLRRWVTPYLADNYNAILYQQATCRIIKSYQSEQKNELHHLNLAGCKLESLPELFIRNFTRLMTINLSNNNLTNFPEFILNSKQLGVLSLEGNKITYIPEELFSLPYLKILDVSNNRIVQLPELPAKLKSSCLEELHLGSNKIKTLPQSFSKLQQLKKLTLEINEIDSLEHIFSFKELELLIISFNKIKDIPGKIGNLKALKALIMDGNPITQISEKICDCNSLKKLSIGNCSVTMIPDKLWQTQERAAPKQVDAQQTDQNDDLVPHLIALHFKELSYDLEYPRIIDEIQEKAENLRYFNEYFNQELYKELVYQAGVSAWPEVYRYPNKNVVEHVAKLFRVQLEEAYPEEENILWDKKIISLSQRKNLRNSVLEKLSIALSRALIDPTSTRQSLDFLGMRLIRLPTEVGLLGNLQNLVLSDNHLVEIPAEIAKLPLLKNLNLDGNDLTGLHPEFGQENCLQLMKWSSCLAKPEHKQFFKELDDWLDEKTNFEQINNENIQKIRQYLGFSYVNYTLQEKSIAGQTEKLSLFNQYKKPLVQKYLINEYTLLLYPLDFDTENCQSETTIFPECYLDNKSKLLNLSGLQLKRLPRVLKYFTKLCELDVSNNQLEEIPEEITANLKWLRRLNLRNNQLDKWPNSLHQLSRLEFLEYRGNQAVVPPAAAFVAIPSLYMLADWTPIQLQAVGDSLAQSMNNWVKFCREIEFTQIDSLGDISPWWLTSKNLPEQIMEIIAATNLSLNDLMQQILAHEHCSKDFRKKNPYLFPNCAIQLVEKIKLRYVNFVADDLKLDVTNKHQLTSFKKLEIPNLGLSILPPQLGALARLEIFKISGNPLLSLPKEMGALRNLHTLCYSSLLALNYLPQEIDLLALASLKNIETSPANFSVYLRLFKLQQATWLRQNQAGISQFSGEGNQEESVQESGLGHRHGRYYRTEATLNFTALANTLYRFAVAGIDTDLEHRIPTRLDLEQSPKLLDPMAIFLEFSRKKGIAGIDWVKRLLHVCLSERQIPGQVVYQQLKMPILTRSHLTFLWDHVQSPEIKDMLKLAWANDSDSSELSDKDNLDFSNFKLFGIFLMLFMH